MPQNAPLSIPNTLELTNQDLAIFYEQQIAPRLQEAIGIPQTFDATVAELRVLCPSQENFLQKLEQLNNELEAEQQQCNLLLENIGALYQEIMQDSAVILRLLKLGIRAHQYLTEGPGQYEEYDSSDHDYDPVAARRFSILLARADIYNAVDEHSFFLTMDDYVQSIDDFSKKIEDFEDAPEPVVEQNDFCQEISAMLKKLIDDSEEVSECIRASDNIDDLDGHPSQNDLDKSRSIDEAACQVEDFTSSLDEFAKQWKNLSRLIMQYQAKKIYTQQLHVNFHEVMKSFLNSITHLTPQQAKKTGDRILNDASESMLEQKNLITAKLNLINKIVIRDQLLSPQASPGTITQLTKALAAKEAEIYEIFSQNINEITLSCVYGFIDYLKIKHAIYKIELDKANRFKTIFLAGHADADAENGHALVHVVHNSGTRIAGVRGPTSARGIDSHLARLIHFMNHYNIKHNTYQAILLLQGHDHKSLSRYERGLLLVLEVAIDSKVLDFHMHEKIPQFLASAPPEDPLPIAWVQPAFYESYIDIQHLASITYGEQPNLIDFSDEAEEFYMQLTMYLVQHFSHESNRDAFKMGEGYPVVCLIVSSTGEILSWGVNTGKNNRTRHAEINALYLYFQRYPNETHLPDNVRIFTSLKSCNMCSGGILDCLSSQNVNTAKVIYGQTDPKQLDTELAPIESLSTMDIFCAIDKDYQELKKQQSSQHGATSNAAATFSEEGMKKYLKEMTQIFVTSMQSAQPSYLRVQKHIESFLKAHGLNMPLLLNYGVKKLLLQSRMKRKIEPPKIRKAVSKKMVN